MQRFRTEKVLLGVCSDKQPIKNTILKEIQLMKYSCLKYQIKGIWIFILAIGLSMTACVMEDDMNTVTTFTPDPQQLVTTTITGRVIDQNNAVVAGATVTYKSGIVETMVETDEAGTFILQDVENKGKSAFITVQKSGKFEAFRRLSVIRDVFNYTEIKMNDKTIIGQVSAASGGTLNDNSGASITLPANGIVDANGDGYIGDVRVAMSWIDPSADDLPQRMVGDLSGIDEEGNIRSLGSYGMLQVELLDNAGNELNLGDNQEATLEFPVPESMQSSATASIPLWSYDEEQGTWIQEGEAIYDNGIYVGKVSHFSSWNVDCLEDPIEVNGEVVVKLPDNITFAGSYLSVYVCSEKFGTKGGWLSNDGQFLFYNFPKNTIFELKIVNNCDETIYSQSYGPYVENTDLGVIEVTVDDDFTLISGNAINCDGNAVVNGFVSIEDDNGRKYVHPLDENGFFECSLDACDEVNGALQIVDTEAFLTSDPYTFSSSISDDITFSDIEVCDQIQEFLQVIIDSGAPALYTPDINFVVNDSLSFIGYGSESPNGGFTTFSLYFDEVDLVSLTAEAINFDYYTSDSDINPNGDYYYMTNNDQITITFTTFNNVSGGLVVGTFSGTATNEVQNMSIPIEGSFRVPID